MNDLKSLLSSTLLDSLMPVLRASARLLPALTIMSAALTSAADLPSADEYRANWPRFRGPDGGGVCAKCDVPLTFDMKSGTNIAWKADVPAEGFGSPVVWGDRVFLSGGDDSRCVVMCFDVASGKVLWERAVPKNEEAGGAPDQSGMAAATVATDGLRVYAIFASGDLAALDFEGRVVWSKHLAVPMNTYGHATSLLTWQDRVIVQLDQGEADDKLSKLYAFKGASGEIAWEQSRSVGASWATPIAFDAAGKSQILTLAVPWAISYAADTGTELWRADCLDGEVTPSPIFAGGSVFIVSPSNKLQIVRPDGQGDVTKTHLGWIAQDGVPDVTSPVSNGELVILIDTGGTLTCYDAKTGKKQWEHDMEEECKASPSIVGGKLCLITMKGTVVMVEAAREFKELGRFSLDEQVLASPAFARNQMFVRGLKHLICVGAKKGASAKP